MLLVLIVHADFFSIGSPSASDVRDLPISSFTRISVESLALVCVNVYVIISGYFGIKLRTRSVLNFLFMVIFWRILVTAGLIVFSLQSIGVKKALLLCIPGYDDWFVGSYMLLLLLSPLLNAFVEKSTPRQLWVYASAFTLFQWCLAWIYGIVNQFSGGYSAMSFIGLYIIGAAIRRSLPEVQKAVRRPLVIYFAISFLAAGVLFISMLTLGEYANERIKGMFGAYNGMNVLLASVALFMAFGRMSFTSPTVNRIAASSFAVYLLHMHPQVRCYYSSVCRYLYDHFTFWPYLLTITFFILAVFVTAVAVDQIRIRLWSMLWGRFKR